jgi:membrane protease YdiL (CAAX protease family)
MSSTSPRAPANWTSLLSGLAAVYLLFHWSATALRSDRGQAGLLVGALVVLATLAVERLLFATPIAAAVRGLGLGVPRARGLGAAVVVGAALLAVIPAFAATTSSRVEAYRGWAWLTLGLFAQAGIAEEVLFRGYLFGRIRRGRGFWRAAALATLPFVAVHFVLLGTMDWPVALAAIGLSAVMSFPLAHLFELGGNTIWAPAIVHFVAQGAIKLVTVTSASPTLLPLVWIGACAVLPFVVFAARRPLAG